MANVIEIIFKATDQVSPQTKKVIQSLGGLKTAVGTFAGLFATGAILGKFVKETSEAQAALAQLKAVIESTGGATGRSVEQLTAQAEALQKITTYSDDAIIQMQAVLASFTQIQGVNFDSAVESVLDLAARMGGDLQGAAQQVGKALNDPIRGMSLLARQGVTFTDQQEKTIKSLVDTGRVAEAQGIILDKLKEKYGGAAEAARNTLGGALDALKNAFNNLFELADEESSKAVDGINELTKVLSEQKTKEAAQTLGGAIATSLRAAVGVAVELIGLVQNLGIGIARLTGGVAIDDVEYRTEQLNKARKELERFRSDPLFGPSSTLGSEKELTLLNNIIKAEEERNAAIKARARITGTSIAEAAGNIPKPTESVAESSEQNAKAVVIETESFKGLAAAIAAGTSEYEKQKQALQQNLNLINAFLASGLGKTDQELEALGITREAYNQAAEAAKNLRIELELLNAQQGNLDILLRNDAARTRALADTDLTGGQILRDDQGNRTGYGRNEQFDIANQNAITQSLMQGEESRLSEITTMMEAEDDQFVETLKRWDGYATEAAKNIQGAFVQFFMNPFKDGLKGLLSAFVQLIQRMIAEALAAQAVKALFSAFGFPVPGGAAGRIVHPYNQSPARSMPVSRAAGGLVPVRVGEEGPETAFLPIGTQIMNARQMAFNAGGGMAGGGGFNYQPVYDIRIESSGDPRDIEARLSMMLERRLAQHTQEIMIKIRNNGFGRIR